MAAERVYIAARFTRLPEAERVRGLLEMAGHLVTSHWHRTAGAQERRLVGLTGSDRRRVQAEIAAENWADLRASDTVILLVSHGISGAVAEAAGAYFLGKRLICVGDPEDTTLMLALQGVPWVSRVEDAMEIMADRKGRR